MAVAQATTTPRPAARSLSPFGLGIPIEEYPRSSLPPQREPSPRRPLRGPWVLGPVLVALLLLAIGGVVYLRSSRTESLALPPPTATAAPTLQVDYDMYSRVATVDNVSAALPGAPYGNGSVEPVRPLLTSAALTQLTVHEHYDGNQNWTAVAGFGVVAPEIGVRNDTKATAGGVFDRARSTFYPGLRYRLSDQVSQWVRVGPVLTYALQARVNYSVPKVPSRYDILTVVVIPLPGDDGFAAWFAGIPNDAGKPAHAALVASLNSIRAT